MKGDARGPRPGATAAVADAAWAACQPVPVVVVESKARPQVGPCSNAGGREREREVDGPRQSRSTDMRERERLIARQSIPESSLGKMLAKVEWTAWWHV